MTQLLMKDAKFDFFVDCVEAFETLKKELTKVPIMVKPDWLLPFELICDASDHASTLTILLFDIFSLNKMQKTRLIRWILLIQEFNIEVRDKKGVENIAADHLSRLENLESKLLNEAEIDDIFPDESIMKMDFGLEEPWVADFANYLTMKNYQMVRWVRVLDMQVTLHDKRIVMQLTLHYQAIVMQVTLHDKRIVMQVTLHYEAIMMQVTLHDKRIVMQVTLQVLSNLYDLFGCFMDYFWSCKSVHTYCFSSRNEMRIFGKTIDNDPDGVMSI
nr:hypothetical protein [Tanacetum cinerariifolium]